MPVVGSPRSCADEYPSHVAAAWLGHSEKIADENYRQVTEEHFSRAAIAQQQSAATVAGGGTSRHEKLEIPEDCLVAKLPR